LDKKIERHVEFSGYKFNISYSDDFSDLGNYFMPGAFTRRILASDECRAVCTQGTSLMAGLKNDFEKIPQTELSCRSVINTTCKSEIFQVFTHISKYNANGEIKKGN
jgi:hypothetical protein